MSNNQKPDGWATLSPEGEYIGNDDEIHLDRTETVICAEDWADGYRVVPICLIDPQELAKLRAVSEWAKDAFKVIEHHSSSVSGMGLDNYERSKYEFLEQYRAITAPKEEG